MIHVYDDAAYDSLRTTLLFYCRASSPTISLFFFFFLLLLPRHITPIPIPRRDARLRLHAIFDTIYHYSII